MKSAAPECLKAAAGLQAQRAWPRPHITVGHPGLQRRAPRSSLLLPNTSCQSTAEAGLKLNIWIEWEGASSPSEGYFTQAVGREPACSTGMLGHGPGKQAAGMLNSQLDPRPANLAEGAALPCAQPSQPALRLLSSL